MKTWTLALALLAIGCQPTEEGKPSQDTEPRDTDVVEDTDTGEDTDTEDTDTAEDTDTGEPEDTSPVSVTCTPDDLVFRAEAHDANGNPTETFAPTDMPMLVGIVENPCDDGHVPLETTSTCLVDLWTITGPDGEAQEVRPVCDPTPTAWKVSASDKEEATYQMTSVVEGDYDVEVRFTYGGEVQTMSFTVEAPATP